MTMNEQDRAELERLKQRQSELLAQFIELGRKLSALEARLAIAEMPAPEPALTPPPLPPIIETPRPAVEVRETVIPQPEPIRIEPTPIPEPAMQTLPPEESAAPVEPEPPRIRTFART
jgi:hypothetical protein